MDEMKDRDGAKHKGSSFTFDHDSRVGVDDEEGLIANVEPAGHVHVIVDDKQSSLWNREVADNLSVSQSDINYASNELDGKIATQEISRAMVYRC